VLAEPNSNTFPSGEKEYQRDDPVGLLQAVDLRDVGVVQRGQYLGLALEPGQPVRVACHRGGQHLERHRALQIRVGGP
jgi:hypothetical protein